MNGNDASAGKVPQTANPSDSQRKEAEYPTADTNGIFSTDYDIPDQLRFRIALEEQAFTHALEIMRAIPRGATDLDRVQYLVTMREGLEALADGYGHLGTVYELKEKGKELKELREAAKALRGI